LICNPKLGQSLGSNLYKIRLSASDKGKGKSGGFRLITYLIQEHQRQNVIDHRHKPTRDEKAQFLSSMNSYLGIMKHYRTYRLRKGMIFKHLSVWWWNCVCLKGGIAKFVLRQ
jgi:hypothetical protein